MNKGLTEAIGTCVAWTTLVLMGACASGPEKGTGPAGGSLVAAAPVVEVKSVSGRANPGEKVKEFDLNHDNKPDVWAFFGVMTHPDDETQTKESLVRKEWDFNFDGKVDIRRYYNFRSEIVKDELDLDFDGRFDVTSFYHQGAKIRQEYDFNFDSKPDYWKFFEKKQLARTERDRDFNGRIDRWEYYNQGKLERVALDEDGDGQIDKWLQQKSES